MSILSGLGTLLGLAYAYREVNQTIEDAQAQTEAVDEGVRVQLNPSTETKIPVLYGESYFGGGVTDAAASSDQTTIYHVVTLSEGTGSKFSDSSPTGYSFKNVYLNGNRVQFKADGFTVDKTFDVSGNEDLNMQDLVKVYFYDPTGPLQPDGHVGTTPESYDVIPHWDVINHPMTGLLYAIVEITYNNSKGITGELPECVFQVESDMNLPGDVLYDYMTNSTYGAGIAVADIDTTKITAFNTYCSTGFEYTDAFAVGQSGTLEFNGLLDTGTECLRNMNEIAKCASGWLKYDVQDGKWGVVVNDTTKVLATGLVNGTIYAINQVGTTDFTLVGAANNDVGTIFTATGAGTGTGRCHQIDIVTDITDSNILGDIGQTETQLTQLRSSVDVKYQNTDILDKTDFVKLSVAPGELKANEPQTTMQVSLPFSNKQSLAMKVGLIALRQARLDKIVNFKADYGFTNLRAGDLIRLTSTDAGYTNKIFRILTIKDVEGTNGELFSDITGLEWLPTTYDYDITELGIETDDGIFSIGAIGQPNIPVVTNNEISNIPHIVIDAEVPSGIVDTMEYWITYDVSEPDDALREYVKIGIEVASGGGTFTENEHVLFTYSNLTAGDFFVKVRGTNARATGPYSLPTGLIEYVPEVQADQITPETDWAGLLTNYAVFTLLTNLDDFWDIITGDVGIWDGLQQIFFPSSNLPTGSSIADELLDDTDFLDSIGESVTAAVDLSTHSIDELSDVNTPAPSENDTLVWNGTHWVATPGCCDIVAPDAASCFVLDSLTPANGEELAEYKGAYVMHMGIGGGGGEALVAGSGTAKLYKTDGTLVETLAPAAAEIRDYDVYLPFAQRDECTDYYIIVTQGFVKVAETGCLSTALLDHGDHWHFTTKRFEIGDGLEVPAPPDPPDPEPDPDPHDPPVPPACQDEVVKQPNTTTEQVINFIFGRDTTIGSGNMAVKSWDDDTDEETFTDASPALTNTLSTFGLESVFPTYLATDAESLTLITLTFVEQVQPWDTTGNKFYLWDTSLAQPIINVTAAADGTEYTIITSGDTDFTLYGAADSNPGTVFTMSGGPGTGTGTVQKTGGPTAQVIQDFDLAEEHLVDLNYADIQIVNNWYTVQINPTKCLVEGKTYYITADANAIKGVCNAAWAGIADDSALKFTVEVTPNPDFVDPVQATEASEGPGSVNDSGLINQEVSGDVVPQPGKKVQIREAGTGTIIGEIDADDPEVTIEE